MHALGLKVVNIVPLEMINVARAKMISAFDWSLQRWIKEGNVLAQELEEDEIRIDDDSIIEREIKRKRANVTSKEEEEEEEEAEEEEVEEEDNVIVDLGEYEPEEK